MFNRLGSKNNINNKKNLFNSIFLRYKNDFALCMKKIKIKNKIYKYEYNKLFIRKYRNI